MAQDIFLDEQNMQKITGRATKNGQIKELKRLGVAFFINGKGAPVVTVAAVEGRGSAKAEQEKQKWVPGVLRAAT